MGSQQKRVAIIGAGVSGVTSARHLKTYGIDVVVFERSKQAGGNWTYDPRKPLEPKYPAITASIADFIIDTEKNGTAINEPSNRNVRDTWENEELRFAPPGPAYAGLTNNVSTKLQELKDFPWPEGTPDYVDVKVKGKYIQDYARHFGVEPFIKYNTRVEKLEKVGDRWLVQYSTLIIGGPEKGKKLHADDTFDVVVVASGHYHASKVPDIPGLKEWKQQWPERVQHCKGYRTPDDFKDQTVLLIGAGVSSADIAREIAPYARKVYQSSRGGLFDFPADFLPSTTERVVGIQSLNIPSESTTTSGSVTLTDGRIIENIDRIIICTGYLFALPFLPNLHDDTTPAEQANETVLVTDGLQLHNLHKDIFYIPDPTLVFIGVPAYTATFSFFEYQSIVAAAVISGRAWLPSEKEMRKEYQEKVKAKGYGRSFHSLKDQQVQYVNDVLAWINKQAEETGGEKIEGHSKEWIAEAESFLPKYRKYLQDRLKGL